MAAKDKRAGRRFYRNLRRGAHSIGDGVAGAYEEAIPEDTRRGLGERVRGAKQYLGQKYQNVRGRVANSAAGQKIGEVASNLRTPEGRTTLRNAVGNTVQSGVDQAKQTGKRYASRIGQEARLNTGSAASRANERLIQQGKAGSASGPRFVGKPGEPPVDMRQPATEKISSREIKSRLSASTPDRPAVGKTKLSPPGLGVTAEPPQPPRGLISRAAGGLARGAARGAGSAGLLYLAEQFGDQVGQLGARGAMHLTGLNKDVTGKRTPFFDDDINARDVDVMATDLLSGQNSGFEGQRSKFALEADPNAGGLFTNQKQFEAINPTLPPEEFGQTSPPPDDNQPIDNQPVDNQAPTRGLGSIPQQNWEDIYNSIDRQVGPGGDLNNTGRQRLTLRDALSGFRRSGNPLADAMKLQARLGLTSASNTNLRNDLELGEEQRQNDFNNALDLGELDRKTAKDRSDAAAAQDASDLDQVKVENQTLNSVFADIDKRDISDKQKQMLKNNQVYTQAQRVAYDPRHQSTQMLTADLMQKIGEQDEGIAGRLAEALPEINIMGIDIGGSPNFKIGDVLDPTTPTFSPQTMDLFSISENGQTLMVKDRDTGQLNPVFDLDEIGNKTQRDTLREVLAARKKYNSLRRGQ